MSFLATRPNVTVVASEGKYTTFAADLHLTPIPREHVDQNQPIFESIERRAGAYMLRTTCHFDFMGVVADERGIMLIMQSSKKLQLCNAKSGVLSMIGDNTEEQKELLTQTFRPLDQLDADRIQEWVSVESLRPIPPMPWKPTAYNMDEVRKRSIEDCVGRNWPFWGCESECTTLALPQTTDLAIIAPSRLQKHWLEEAQHRATLVIVQAGEWPEHLNYVACRSQPRRDLLLKEYMKKDKSKDHSMVKAIRAAKKLSDMKMIPLIVGARSRKSEFIKFCATVVKSIDETAETVVTKLSEADQFKIRCIFGSTEEVYSGCLSEACLDFASTEWIVADLSTNSEKIIISRCSRCYVPKAWGRKMNCNSMYRIGLRKTAAACVPDCQCDSCSRALKKRRGL